MFLCSDLPKVMTDCERVSEREIEMKDGIIPTEWIGWQKPSSMRREVDRLKWQISHRFSFRRQHSTWQNRCMRSFTQLKYLFRFDRTVWMQLLVASAVRSSSSIVIFCENVRLKLETVNRFVLGRKWKAKKLKIKCHHRRDSRVLGVEVWTPTEKTYSDKTDESILIKTIQSNAHTATNARGEGWTMRLLVEDNRQCDHMEAQQVSVVARLQSQPADSQYTDRRHKQMAQIVLWCYRLPQRIRHT